MRFPLTLGIVFFPPELYNLLLKMGFIYKVNWAAPEARVGQL